MSVLATSLLLIVNPDTFLFFLLKEQGPESTCSPIPLFLCPVAPAVYHGGVYSLCMRRGFMSFMPGGWFDIIPPRSRLSRQHEYPLKPPYGDGWGEMGRGELVPPSVTSTSGNAALSTSKVMRAHFLEAGLSFLLLPRQSGSTLSSFRSRLD